MIICGTVIFALLFCGKMKAGYGRYHHASGLSVPSNLAWFIQELPSWIIPVTCMAISWNRLESTNALLISMFLIHYTHRTFVFPLLIRGGKPTPVSLMISAIVFTSLNGWLQGRYLAEYATYPKGWLYHPQFLIGVAMFFGGMLINIQADSILRNLRKPGDTNYYVPYGGMFKYVSGANFFGEIVEWWGFAFACNSLPAYAFAFFTFFNIGPRGVQHHEWYLEKFGDKYPKERKGVIPFIW
jgi:3-oxo-5-alpha-steroid 4-dehydrogenase 1